MFLSSIFALMYFYCTEFWFILVTGFIIYLVSECSFLKSEIHCIFFQYYWTFHNIFPNFFTEKFINPDSMGTMRLFLHQHLIVESIKRIMTTFTFDALRAATVLTTMYNNAALSLWKKMGLEGFWSRILNFEHKILQSQDSFEEVVSKRFLLRIFASRIFH